MGAEIHSAPSKTTSRLASSSGRRNGRNTLPIVSSRTGATAAVMSISGSPCSGGSASTALVSFGDTRDRPASVAASPLIPGPCDPDQAGICLDLIKNAPDSLPILGVCLGHQAIGQAFGGDVIRAKQLMHGKTSQIAHDNTGIFAGLANPFTATRYHSLAVKRETLPDTLKVTAWTEDGEIMGLAHATRPIHGVQFHPESILTEGGHDLLANFLNLAGVKRLVQA